MFVVMLTERISTSTKKREFSNLEPWGFSQESLCPECAALVCSNISFQCFKILLLEDKTLVHVKNGIRVEKNICFGKLGFF